jgi:hypothetical protein
VNSDQRLIAYISVFLIILVVKQLYWPYLSAMMFNAPDSGGGGISTGGVLGDIASAVGGSVLGSVTGGLLVAPTPSVNTTPTPIPSTVVTPESVQ